MKKNIFRSSLFFLILIHILTLFSCKKYDAVSPNFEVNIPIALSIPSTEELQKELFYRNLPTNVVDLNEYENYEKPCVFAVPEIDLYINLMSNDWNKSEYIVTYKGKQQTYEMSNDSRYDLWAIVGDFDNDGIDELAMFKEGGFSVIDINTPAVIKGECQEMPQYYDDYNEIIELLNAMGENTVYRDYVEDDEYFIEIAYKDKKIVANMMELLDVEFCGQIKSIGHCLYHPYTGITKDNTFYRSYHYSVEYTEEMSVPLHTSVRNGHIIITLRYENNEFIVTDYFVLNNIELQEWKKKRK